MAVIYIASPFEKQAFCKMLRDRLVAAGHTVQARWLDEDPSTNTMETVNLPFLKGMAQRDITDILAADLIVVYNPSDFYHAGTGGRHVELGYALAKGKEILLIGRPSNVFHSLVRSMTFLEFWSYFGLT